MDAVVDMIPIGEAVLPVKEDPSIPVDLLGRREIVNRIMDILEVISEKESSCTFALNGAWGTGKTFVLNMLMNQLWKTHSDKYIVFHYNCWQYDYYEEPLIAIVAAMLDCVDEENHLLPAKLRKKVKDSMEAAKPFLTKIAIDFVKNKIGVDLTEVVSTVKDFKEALDNEEQKRTEAHSFDEFYSFKKAIGLAQAELRKLTSERTLVVVVDELDRCLPSYAIKVLERLHHLFGEISNSAVFLAIDKIQLDKTISQIFGNGTDTTKYLRKFVNFELQLDVGEIKNGFCEKHSEYFTMFDPTLIRTDFPFEKFITDLVSGIDMRTQERLMERIKTVHSILFPYHKKDYSFLCCELIYSVFSEIYGIDHPGAIVRHQNHPSDFRIPILEYSIQGPVPERIAKSFHDIWSVSGPIRQSNIFHCNADPEKCNYFVSDGKHFPGGSIIIQELLYYYLQNLFAHEDNKSEFEFAFLPVPENYYLYGQSGNYHDIHIRETVVLLDFCKDIKGFEELKEVFYEYLQKEDSMASLYKSCLETWLKHYADSNLQDLCAFRNLFKLLR